MFNLLFNHVIVSFLFVSEMAVIVSHLKLFQGRNLNCFMILKYSNFQIKSRPVNCLFKKYNGNMINHLSVLSAPCFSSNNNHNDNSGNNQHVQYCSNNTRRSSFNQAKYKAVLHDKQEKIKTTSLKIKNQGKLILSDIKETKVKMKEKMEEVIEVSTFIPI